LAILYFVPQDGQLGKNQKRAGHDIFDTAFHRSAARCTSNLTILTTRLKSQAFAPLFLVGHPALPLSRQKPQDRQGR
jgi:hypothetical protein